MRILLAGHPETTMIWEPLAERLQEAPLIWGLPGYGTPMPLGFTPTKEGYLTWLIEKIEQLDEPVDLVGHDWGGILTVRLASLRPELLRSWASDVIGVFDPEHQWHPSARVWQTPGEGEAAIAAGLASTEEEAIEGFGVYGLPREDAIAMRRGWDETMWSCALTLYRSAVHVHAEWGPDLAGARARPGLAIVSDDEFVEKDWHRRAAERAGARIVELHGLGHWWLAQSPAAGAACLEEFWSSLPG
jgi:pimeloyl-ACP methyl ester carboxylesterase